jgi:hypothetical protein
MTVKDIRPALRAFLLGDSGIASAVGNSRVYPVKLPQGVTAASLVYNLVSEVGDASNSGPDGLCQARVQIDAYATTADTAKALALLVKGRLFGASGTWGAGAAAVEVKGVFLGGSSRTEFDDASQLHRVGRDFLIWFWDRA